jgi:hypothetical protein
MAARRPKRALRKRGLVVTEGTCTEPQYVDMLKRHFRGGQVSVKTVGVGQSPMRVLSRARKEVKQAKRNSEPFDWCCLLLDVDQHTDLDECLREALRDGIKVLVSNLKFEVWLVWHVTDLRSVEGTKELDRRVRKEDIMSGKHLNRRFPIHNHPQAVERARRADPDLAAGRVGPNPSSAMPVLIDLMRTGVMKSC